MSIRSKINNLARFWEKDFEPLNTIEISRKNILHNFDEFQKLRPDCQIWPVLKSNAYGHGIKQVVEILKERKFDYFVVDSYFEALKIWEVWKHPVLLIGSTKPCNFKNMNLKNLAISVQDEETLKALISLKRTVKIHLKINTGMNRQGIEIHEIRSMIHEIRKNSHIRLEGVFSHLADADDEIFTKKQEKLFEEAIKIMSETGVNPKYKHLVATAGALKIKKGISNAVRLGIGLYDSALTFNSCFTKIREIEKGEKVSYGGVFEAPKKMKIGLIPVGYFEGIDRRLSGKGYVKFKDQFLPIIGRICMNLLMVDLRNASVKLYDSVQIISSNKNDKNSVYNLAKICDTIPYEILVKLSESIRRKII